LHRAETTERVPDEYLVALARLGDPNALALLAERWNRKFLAHGCRLLGDNEAARDAVQEAWAEIIRCIGRLDDPRAFPAWAYRIVSRRCTRLIGGVQRRRQLQREVADGLSTLHGDADDVRQAEGTRKQEDTSDMDKLRAAIRALPPGQRAAVALFHLEEMSIAEVAVALDVPAGTVKTRLMHARRKLRAVLEGER
jgi:RNA polymerase sigma-70 factor (ECF subfamily)